MTQNISFRPLGSLFLFFYCLMSVFWTWPSRKSPTKRQGWERLTQPLISQHSTLSCSTHAHKHTHTHISSLALNMLCWELCLALLITGFPVWALPSTNIKITQGECHQNQRQGYSADTVNMLSFASLHSLELNQRCFATLHMLLFIIYSFNLYFEESLPSEWGCDMNAILVIFYWFTRAQTSSESIFKG